MKKILPFIIVAVLVSGCNKNTFTISGTVDNKKLNGKTIYIKERINRVWITIDSTIINEGSFLFEGNADTAKMAYLVYEFPADKKVKQAFVLENGKIKASIDTTGYMKFNGTNQNDLFQNYQDLKIDFYKNAEKTYNANNDSVLTPEQKLVIASEMEQLNKKETEIDKKFVVDNINTIIGTHVFLNSFYAWGIAEKEITIALFNDETKNIQRVKEIIADIKIEKKLSVGNTYIDIKLANVKGDSIALSDLVGKTDYVLVDFWASWCGPCVQAFPELKALYDKNKGRKFEILGVSLDDNNEAWTNAIVTHKLDWTQISDLKGWKSKGSRTYAVNSIPCTILIDKKGKIIGRNISISEIEKQIK